MKNEKQQAVAAAAFAEWFKLYQGMNACPTHARGQKKRNYMKKGEIELRKCTNNELKEMLSACPDIIDELRKRSAVTTGDWIDLYDLLLFEHGMSLRVVPVYKNDTDTVLFYGYHYSIDGEEIERFDCEEIKSFAEAQLQAVHDTMYRLRERL